MGPSTGRRSRRSAQSKADRERSARSAAEQRKARGRRRAVVAGIITLPLVVGGVVWIALSGSPAPTTPPAPAPSAITTHTVMRLPTASALAQREGAAWVTDDLRSLLIRVDPSSGRRLASVRVSGRPVAMVLVGQDLWIAEMVTNTVDEYSALGLHKIRSVPVPTGPSGLAVLNGQVWVSSVIASTVTPIDARSGKAGAQLSVPAGAVRVAAGFGSIWVTGIDQSLTPISFNVHGTGPVLPAIVVGKGPIGVTVGDGSVWVADATSGDIVRVDPNTRTVQHTYHVGGDPLSIAVAAGRVYVGDGVAQTLRTVFPSPGAKPVNIATTPRALLAVGSGVWVAGANPGRIVSAQVG